MVRLILLPLFVLAGVACSRAESPSRPENVFGEDHRTGITSDMYPWRTIGRLVSPEGGTCTGTIVGRDLVLTAAHCVEEGIVFQPNYHWGQAPEAVAVLSAWRGTGEPATHTGDDWAVLRTASPVGESYGWLSVVPTTVDSFPSDVQVAGYSGDFEEGQTPGIDRDCKVRGRDPAQGLILHDCDTTRGASGGPALLWDDGVVTVYGINVAERREGGETSMHRAAYDDEHANVLIPSAAAAAKLATLQ